MINEIGIKSQSTLSKLFHSENDYIPLSKIFPKKSKNLFNFNMFGFHDSDFPFKEVLFSEGSVEEVEKKYLLALNEIEKKDILEERYKEEEDFDDDFFYSYEEYYDDEDHTEGILESNKIFINKLSYPETYNVDNETGYGVGNLNIFDLEFKKLYFLDKPFGSQYFLLWGNEKEIKYFLPLKFIIKTDFLDVIVRDK